MMHLFHALNVKISLKFVSLQDYQSIKTLEENVKHVENGD